MKKNIAIVTGGYSKEAEISLKSANTVYENLNKNLHNYYMVYLFKDRWYVAYNNEEISIDKNDFSWQNGSEKITFDLALIVLHGTPGEDGLLQGYFEIINLPYSTGDQLAMSITFNKWMCNQFLMNLGYDCGKAIILKNKNQVNINHIAEQLGFPCFVKPNTAGSSVGVSKVRTLNELETAIKVAFEESKEVMVEEFLEGTEVTCGVFEGADGVLALPLTELVSHNDFFDYNAKYKGESDEITPARISDEIRDIIQLKTKEIYQTLNLKGIARIDYIIRNNQPFLIEINTIPGLSKESIVPQQIAANKLKLNEVLEEIVKKLLP